MLFPFYFKSPQNKSLKAAVEENREEKTSFIEWNAMSDLEVSKTADENWYRLAKSDLSRFFDRPQRRREISCGLYSRRAHEQATVLCGLVTPFRGVVSSWSDSDVDAAADAAAAAEPHRLQSSDSGIYWCLCVVTVGLTSPTVIDADDCRSGNRSEVDIVDRTSKPKTAG